MQARSKSIILLALLTNLLVSPAQVVEAKSLNLFPLKPVQPSGVPTRFTPFPPFKPRPTPPNPAPTPEPEPEPEPEQVALTPEQIAAGELALKNAIIRYAADMERAEENYSSARTSNDMLSWDLASDELYLDEIKAELDFWNTAGDWVGVINGGVWAGITFKVGQDFVATSPVVQTKVAGLLAMLAGASGLAATKIIQQKQDEYKILYAKQRLAVDSRLQYLLWQMDYGGQGQPAPNSDLGSLFPGCIVQSTCVDAWVCTTNSGSNRDCEKQQVCEDRIVKC